MSEQRVIVDVDAREPVSLARFGVKSTQLVVASLPDGGLVLHEAVALTPARQPTTGIPPRWQPWS
ncbi:MAG TPA: hypothetical protein VGC03_04195 [Acidimicrobiia bacterium]